MRDKTTLGGDSKMWEELRDRESKSVREVEKNRQSMTVGKQDGEYQNNETVRKKELEF